MNIHHWKLTNAKASPLPSITSLQTRLQLDLLNKIRNLEWKLASFSQKLENNLQQEDASLLHIRFYAIILRQ